MLQGILFLFTHMAKKQYVQEMFDHISPTYDKLNHILSLNIDKSWRNKAVRMIADRRPQHVLDIACGTGDFSIALAKAGVPMVQGIDISEGMMKVGRAKIDEQRLSGRIRFQQEDSEAMTFSDSTFDAVSVAFGIRNFEHRERALKEMYRVLRPGGMLLVLELSVPRNRILRGLYKLYFLHILPAVGNLISRDAAAYRYLPASVLSFPPPETFCRMVGEAGFVQVESRALTFGLCRIFTGVRNV